MIRDVTARTGDMIWMLNTWMRYVATAEDTGGRLAVLEGRLAAAIGDSAPVTAGPGEFVFLPRQVPHGLHAQTPQVRGLVLLTPAGFEQFFAAVGQPAPGGEMPEPAAPDVAAVAAAAARYGVTVLPPG